MRFAGVKRQAKRPFPGVAAWLRFIRIALKQERKKTKVREADVVRFAALVSLLGAPEDHDAQAAYGVLKELLLEPHTPADRKHGRPATSLPTTLDRIPPDAKHVRRLSDAVVAFKRETGRPLEKTFRVDSVVAVILQVPDPTAYVAHLKAKGFDGFAGMFHPNTLIRARKDLRGVFGRFEGESEYWDQVGGRVRTVE